jgi:uncharacterized protein (TIGR00304 family)
MLLIGGASMVAASVATGEADLALVVIFPVVSGSGGLFLLGVALIVSGLLLGFVLITMQQSETTGYRQKEGGSSDTGPRPVETGTRYGGVVLLGPVPIAFGSDRSIAVAMLVLGIVVAVVSLALIFVFLS